MPMAGAFSPAPAIVMNEYSLQRRTEEYPSLLLHYQLLISDIPTTRPSFDLRMSYADMLRVLVLGPYWKGEWSPIRFWTVN